MLLLVVSSWVLFFFSVVIFLIAISFFSSMNFLLQFHSIHSFNNWTILLLKW